MIHIQSTKSVTFSHEVLERNGLQVGNLKPTVQGPSLSVYMLSQIMQGST
jgi:hypothetical protein